MWLFSIGMNIERSIIVNAEKNKVWEYITDGNKKNVWSPWVMFERDCEQTFEWTPWEIWYREYWKGKVIGEGEQIATGVQAWTMIANDLNFMKPFKSKNTTDFSLEEVEWGIKVTWKMIGSLPFFLFTMKKKMEMFIGMDFERGLMMLKDAVETGVVPTSTQYIWSDKIMSEKYCIYLEKKCTKAEMEKNMMWEFEELYKILEEKGMRCPLAFTIYKKVDLVKDIFHYQPCVELSSAQYKALEYDVPTWCYTGMVEKNDEQKYAQVTHMGGYKYMMNSWTGIMMYLEADGWKMDDDKESYEIYEKWPQHKGVEEKDYITQIMVPLK